MADVFPACRMRGRPLSNERTEPLRIAYSRSSKPLCERRRLDPPMAAPICASRRDREAMTQYQHPALDRDHQPARDELRNRLGAHQTQVCTAAVSTYALRIKEEAEALSRPPAASLVELRSRFEKASAESNHPQEWQGAAFSGMWDAVERFSSKRESEHAHLSTQLAEAKLATEQPRALPSKSEWRSRKKQGSRSRPQISGSRKSRRSWKYPNGTSDLPRTAQPRPRPRSPTRPRAPILPSANSRRIRAMLDEARAKPNTPPPPPGSTRSPSRWRKPLPPRPPTSCVALKQDGGRRGRLLALEAEVEELSATRAERDDLKDRIRSHAEELARASAAADELPERRSSEEAERTRKESEDAVSEMQALLRKEREQGKRQREALVASADAAANSSAEALRQAQEGPNRPVARWRETSKSTGRKSGPYRRRLGERIRDRTIRLEPARAGRDGGRRTKGDHGAPRACHLQSLQRERETNATHAELVKRLTDGARESERRAATVEAKLEVSERRREALETELTELQQRLTGGQQATADRAALRRELEAVRAMKDDVEVEAGRSPPREFGRGPGPTVPRAAPSKARCRA